MSKRVLLAVVLCCVCSAESSADTQEEITELKRQLAEMQKRLERLEAKQTLQSETISKQSKSIDQTIEDKVSKIVEEKKLSALPKNLDWLERIQWYGDFRYRYENIDLQNNAGQDLKGRNRNRIRVRLGAKVKIDDEWKLNFRIASGSADPASTNQTLENGFTSKDIWLDLGYFEYNPAWWQNLTAYGGKMKNPFYCAGGNQLIWDGDVNPEGFAVTHKSKLGEHDTLHLTGAGFWMDYDAAGIDTALWAGQAYVKHTFDEGRYLLGGGSFYDYGNIKGELITNIFDRNRAENNTLDAANRYVYDYDMAEAFAEYGFMVNSLPVRLYGSYVNNIAATTSEDKGWLMGIKVNKAKKPGSWEFGYNYREVDKDAVLGALNDSDFNGGSTDARGHKFGLKYQLSNNLQAGLTYFLSERDNNRESKYRRLQADLKFKF